jgi:hypothetical protein
LLHLLFPQKQKSSTFIPEALQLNDAKMTDKTALRSIHECLERIKERCDENQTHEKIEDNTCFPNVESVFNENEIIPIKETFSALPTAEIVAKEIKSSGEEQININALPPLNKEILEEEFIPDNQTVTGICLDDKPTASEEADVAEKSYKVKSFIKNDFEMDENYHAEKEIAIVQTGNKISFEEEEYTADNQAVTGFHLDEDPTIAKVTTLNEANNHIEPRKKSGVENVENQEDDYIAGELITITNTVNKNNLEEVFKPSCHLEGKPTTNKESAVAKEAYKVEHSMRSDIGKDEDDCIAEKLVTIMQTGNKHMLEDEPTTDKDAALAEEAIKVKASMKNVVKKEEDCTAKEEATILQIGNKKSFEEEENIPNNLAAMGIHMDEKTIMNEGSNYLEPFKRNGIEKHEDDYMAEKLVSIVQASNIHTLEEAFLCGRHLEEAPTTSKEAAVVEEACKLDHSEKTDIEKDEDDCTAEELVTIIPAGNKHMLEEAFLPGYHLKDEPNKNAALAEEAHKAEPSLKNVVENKEDCIAEEEAIILHISNKKSFQEDEHTPDNEVVMGIHLVSEPSTMEDVASNEELSVMIADEKDVEKYIAIMQTGNKHTLKEVVKPYCHLEDAPTTSKEAAVAEENCKLEPSMKLEGEKEKEDCNTEETASILQIVNNKSFDDGEFSPNNQAVGIQLNEESTLAEETIKNDVTNYFEPSKRSGIEEQEDDYIAEELVTTLQTVNKHTLEGEGVFKPYCHLENEPTTGKEAAVAEKACNVEPSMKNVVEKRDDYIAEQESTILQIDSKESVEEEENTLNNQAVMGIHLESEHSTMEEVTSNDEFFMTIVDEKDEEKYMAEEQACILQTDNACAIRGEYNPGNKSLKGICLKDEIIAKDPAMEEVVSIKESMKKYTENQEIKRSIIEQFSVEQDQHKNTLEVECSPVYQNTEEVIKNTVEHGLTEKDCTLVLSDITLNAGLGQHSTELAYKLSHVDLSIDCATSDQYDAKNGNSSMNTADKPEFSASEDCMEGNVATKRKKLVEQVGTTCCVLL